MNRIVLTLIGVVVFLPATVVAQGDAITFAAVVNNSGNAATGATSYAVSFQVDGSQVATGTSSASIPPGGSTTVTAAATFTGISGAHTVLATADTGNTIAQIELTQRECQLLELLLRHKEEVLSRSYIAERVWEMSFDGDSNVVDTSIWRLRAKIDDAFERKLIHTVRGRGYVLR